MKNYMKYDEAVKLLTEDAVGLKSALTRYYGQISIRMTEDTYLSTGAIKQFKDISEGDLPICDINTGDVGAIFNSISNVNIVLFAFTPIASEISSEIDFLESAIDDLAMIAGTGIRVVEDTSPENVIAPLSDCGVCLIKGRGILVAAPNMKKAVAGALIAEKSCEAYYYGKRIGGVKPFSKEVALDIRSRFLSKYVDLNQESHVDYIGFDENSFEHRAALVDGGKQMAADELTCGSWGNFSVRLDDENMLITPSSMDFQDVKIEDIVKVNINTLEYGDQRVPSGESPLHARMYRELPDCNAIIHTHSSACSVFAACEAGFAMMDKQLRQIIGDVKVVPYHPAGSEELSWSVIIAMENTHALILAHHGAIFYGPNRDIVYQVAKAVEQMAQNLLKYGEKMDEADGAGDED